MLAGCAGTTLQTLREGRSTTLDRVALDVPFFPDRSDQCGPSVLASVLTFWNHPVNLAALKHETYLAHLNGSLPMDLMLAAQRRGFIARLYDGSLDDLKSELRQGHPLIAFTNRGTRTLPIGHYVVITGIDEARQGVTMHSGGESDRFVSFKRFLKGWDKTQRATLLILPPGLEMGPSRASL